MMTFEEYFQNCKKENERMYNWYLEMCEACDLEVKSYEDCCISWYEEYERISVPIFEEEDVCQVCGGEIVYDDVEGICLECGNAWIIDENKFEERIEYEFGIER